MSQVEAAGRLGVDRTTTVSLIDGPEDQGLVERRRSPQNRRKNVVKLAPAGEERLRRRRQKARRAAERRFLAPLDEETAATLVRALQMLPADEADERVSK